MSSLRRHSGLGSALRAAVTVTALVMPGLLLGVLACQALAIALAAGP